MIQITPAILTNDLLEFEAQLERYAKTVGLIDVDINVENDGFDGNLTVHLEDALELIASSEEANTVKFNLHLMVDFPSEQIEAINNFKFVNRVFVHQETVIEDIEDYLMLEKRGLAIKAESSLKAIDFYSRFSEIQLMTIKTGEQGNAFKVEVLNRVEELKKLGYKGKISIDGGVNLMSADLIKRYPIDRVSVGSFFSKSIDFERDYELLDKALNG